jgi:hypothetical protein
VAATVALAALTGVALAAPEPVGPDFRISQVGSDGEEGRDADSADVAYNPAANEYLVVWEANGLPESGEFEIFGQRVSAGGAELGGDFRISETGIDGDPARDALNPAVAYKPAANEYLVVWQGDPVTKDEVEIYGQRLSATGAKQGTSFRISNVGPDGDVSREGQNPAVASARCTASGWTPAAPRSRTKRTSASPTSRKSTKAVTSSAPTSPTTRPKTDTW